MADRGRPTKFTQEIFDTICDNISKGITLSEQLRDDETLPRRTAIYEWMEKDEELNGQFLRARARGFDEIAEECLRIADAVDGDTIITENGAIPNGEWIARSKIRIDTRIKLLSKWSPRQYGDKMDLTTDGEKLQPASIAVTIVKPIED